MKNIYNLHILSQLKRKNGFTLVELIIVLTILAILAIIAFISFQNYSKDSRDAHRVATLKNIEKWLHLYQLKIGKYLDPEEKIQILSGSIVLIQQWIIWKDTSQIIKLNKAVYDPKDGTNYIYATTGNKKKYQLWTYLEEDSLLSFLQTYANDIEYTNRYFYTIWDLVWIVLDEEKNQPIWIETYPSGTLDITDEENKNKIFTIHFSNDTDSGSISDSWNLLTEIIQINQNTTPEEINSTQNCWSTPHNQVKLFWNVVSVLPGNTCPDWTEFTCINGDWAHETFNKEDYPYVSCMVWSNNCTLTDGLWWVVLSDTNPSCYLLN